MRTGKNIIGFPEPRGNNKKNRLGRETRNRPPAKPWQIPESVTASCDFSN
jgi:hypothetical protein